MDNAIDSQEIAFFNPFKIRKQVLYINKIYYHPFHPEALPEPDVSLLAQPAPIDQPEIGGRYSLLIKAPPW